MSAMVSMGLEFVVASCTDGQQDKTLSTTLADDTAYCEAFGDAKGHDSSCGSSVVSVSDNEAFDSDSDSDNASSCASEKLCAKVRIADPVAIRGGLFAGQIGTVIHDDESDMQCRGYNIVVCPLQVQLSSGTVAWFARRNVECKGAARHVSAAPLPEFGVGDAVRELGDGESLDGASNVVDIVNFEAADVPHCDRAPVKGGELRWTFPELLGVSRTAVRALESQEPPIKRARMELPVNPKTPDQACTHEAADEACTPPKLAESWASGVTGLHPLAEVESLHAAGDDTISCGDHRDSTGVVDGLSYRVCCLGA